MPKFSITLSFKSDSERKRRLETVISELRDNSAHVIDIKSHAAKVGEPPTTISKVIITYKSRKRIKLEEQHQ